MKDIQQLKINQPKFKNFKTASSDSGFYQQLSHDEDNNASCIYPAKWPSIRPSNHPSLYPSNDIYSELKLPEGNELVPNQEHSHQEPQNQFKETRQDFDSQGNGGGRRIETSDKATETEDDFKSSIDPRPTENFYSFLGSKPIPLTITTTTTTNFRDQYHKDYNNNENFATPLPEVCFGLNGPESTTHPETPYVMVGMDGRHPTDRNTNLNHGILNLLQPSETLNLTFRPKSTSYSPHNIAQTFHPKALTCSNCNMNFEDHSRHLCCQVDDDDDDDDLTSLRTGTIPCDVSLCCCNFTICN